MDEGKERGEGERWGVVQEEDEEAVAGFGGEVVDAVAEVGDVGEPSCRGRVSADQPSGRQGIIPSQRAARRVRKVCRAWLRDGRRCRSRRRDVAMRRLRRRLWSHGAAVSLSRPWRRESRFDLEGSVSVCAQSGAGMAERAEARWKERKGASERPELASQRSEDARDRLTKPRSYAVTVRLLSRSGDLVLCRGKDRVGRSDDGTRSSPPEAPEERSSDS